jgi:hypothetical protein
MSGVSFAGAASRRRAAGSREGERFDDDNFTPVVERQRGAVGRMDGKFVRSVAKLQSTQGCP